MLIPQQERVLGGGEPFAGSKLKGSVLTVIH